MTQIVDIDALDELVQRLRADGRTVIAPTVTDGTITPGEITSASELPIGWSEDQDGGRYTLVATGDDRRFASSTPSDSWKRYLAPPETLLVRSRRDADGLHIEAPAPEAPRLAFVGIRSCDLAAIGILDRVFLAPAAVDPTYASRRSDLVTISVACANPGNTCFCASMDTGPSPLAGFDLSLVELHDGDAHRFAVEIGSPAGAAMMDGIASTPATAAHERAIEDQHRDAVASMGRALDPAAPPLAAAAPEHPRWDDVAARCLACGNCTAVCPTCFCSATQDRSDLSGDESSRWRVWDSCFSADFSSLHGVPVRATIRDRYRQWLLHKLVTWHDQFDSSGCVGCGRCITACPVGIDLTAEIAAMADA